MATGWIQVTPNRRYFQHQDGTPFFSIGHARRFFTLVGLGRSASRVRGTTARAPRVWYN
jgi:hypothetical protein